MLLIHRRPGPKSDHEKTAHIIHSAQRTFTRFVLFPTLALYLFLSLSFSLSLSLFLSFSLSPSFSLFLSLSFSLSLFLCLSVSVGLHVDLSLLHSCTFVSHVTGLSCALDHSSSAFALAQVVPQNRVAFDSLSVSFSLFFQWWYRDGHCARLLRPPDFPSGHIVVSSFACALSDFSLIRVTASMAQVKTIVRVSSIMVAERA